MLFLIYKRFPLDTSALPKSWHTFYLCCGNVEMIWTPPKSELLIVLQCTLVNKVKYVWLQFSPELLLMGWGIQ